MINDNKTIFVVVILIIIRSIHIVNNEISLFKHLKFEAAELWMYIFRRVGTRENFSCRRIKL